MNSLNEIIIPKFPKLSFSYNQVNINAGSTELRGRHFHKEFEIFKIKEGSLLVSSVDLVQQLNAGDIVFINSFYMHEFKIVSNHCDAIYFQIDFQPYIENFLESQNDFLYHFLHIQQTEKIKVFSTDKICDIINQIEYEIENKQEFFDMQIKAYIYQLIVYLLRYNFILDNNQIHKKSIERILPAIDYINENMSKKIALDELCDLLHIDKYYFCKLFKQTIGSTFTEYVNFVRLYKAKQLLINNDLSVAEVALECGFASTQYFNKLFKKQHGVSPTHYIKLLLNN